MEAPLDSLSHIGAQFQIYGRFLRGFPIGKGHINETYAADYDYGGRTVRFVHQTINHQVFSRPELVMENVVRVTDHKARRLQDYDDSQAGRKTLTVIPTREGGSFHHDDSGNYWRTYIFIDRTTSLDTIETTEQAFEAARAYGEFQKLLVDLPGDRLHETIPDFHHPLKRYASFEEAVANDNLNRAAKVAAEIKFVRRRRDDCRILLDLLESGDLPERITHNDTKLNNVLFDDATGKAICVVDLDTVMPGLVLYDFGDLVRTSTSPAVEDERDLSKVEMQMPMFEALVEGYWEAAQEFLCPCERDHLAFSGKLLSFIIGMRFLTDFLNGDIYFKVRRPGHNLDRARAQFKLVESIERQLDGMQRVVDRVINGDAAQSLTRITSFPTCVAERKSS